MKYRAMAVIGVLSISAGTNHVFAQPILDRVEQLLRSQVERGRGPAAAGNEAVKAGYLGLLVDDQQDAGTGVRVVEVVGGSAAAQAGLQTGDLITSIDGQPIRTSDDMARAMQGKSEGAKLLIHAARGGREREYRVTLGRRAEPSPAENREELPEPLSPPTHALPNAPPARLGLRTLAVTDAVMRQNNLPDRAGAMVIAVAPGSAADSAGIPLGAVIRSVDDKPISGPQELAAAIRDIDRAEVEIEYVYLGAPVRKKVSLTAAGPRGEAPRPSDGPALEMPLEARIATLEARIKALEARIEQLEAKLAAEPAPENGP